VDDILCASCLEHDDDVSNCDGCENLVCPECLKTYESDPLKIVSVCPKCHADPLKEIALTAHFTPEYVAKLRSNLN
jgi:predicted Zn-ribbon and HTH transcriptional regulator